MAVKTKAFDASKYIETEADQTALLMDALESGNAGYIANALGVIAKSRNMSELSRKTGIARQALYAALSPDGNPTLDTVVKVIGALGIKLTVESEPAVPERRMHYVPASMVHREGESESYLMTMGYPTKAEARCVVREMISAGGGIVPAVIGVDGFGNHIVIGTEGSRHPMTTVGYAVVGPNRTEGGSVSKKPAKRAKEARAET